MEITLLNSPNINIRHHKYSKIDPNIYASIAPKNCLPKTRIARGDTYAFGWLAGVKSKLQAFANTPEDEAAITAYKEDRCADMKDAKPKNRTSGANIKPTDFHQGHSAGKAASLHHGVGARQQALIGGAA